VKKVMSVIPYYLHAFFPPYFAIHENNNKNMREKDGEISAMGNHRHHRFHRQKSVVVAMITTIIDPGANRCQTPT
jgi:hypothetical protein